MGAKPIIAGMLILLAIGGSFFYITNLEETYYCETREVVSMCFKLSNANSNGLSSRCYHTEETPTRYYNCKSGWKPIADFPDIIDNLTIQGNEITIKSYDSSIEKIIFSNSKTSQIYGNAELKVDYINHIYPGRNTPFTRIKVNSSVDFDDAINSTMELIDLNTNKTIVRPIIAKELIITPRITDDFELVCKNLMADNLTTYEFCEDVKNGTKVVYDESWIDATYDLKEGEIKELEFFMPTYAGDYIEYIPNIYSVDVTEWAIIIVHPNLLHQYVFNEVGGSTSKDTLGTANLSNMGLSGGSFVSGKIGNAYAPDDEGTNIFINGFNGNDMGSEFSICAWVRRTASFSGNGYACFWSDGRGPNGWGYCSNQDGGGDRDFINTDSTGTETTLALNTWTWRCHIENRTEGKIYSYADNSLVANSPVSRFIAINTTNDIILFAKWDGGGELSEAQIDDLRFYNKILTPTERANIYNSGDGCETCEVEIIVNNLVGRVLTFGGEIIDGATVLILNATGSLIASVTSNSTGDWMYPWSTDIVNFTIVGYNGDNISQGGNAYPFING